MADPVWRKSSYSDNGKCLEIAETDGTVLVRNSQDPEGVTLALALVAVATFIAACSAGEHDDLA